MSNCTLFCLGVQFVPKDLLHIPNSRKIFNVRMQVIFGEKSLSSLFRISRQDLTTVFPAMWCCFTTAKGAENRPRAVHVCPRGFERCTAIFDASFAGLFWALQAPCGVASYWKERHESRGNMGKITQFRGWFSNIFVNVESPTAPIEGSRTSQQTCVRRCWGNFVQQRFTNVVEQIQTAFCSTTFSINKARSYGAILKLIFQGRYALPKGYVSRLRCSLEVNL